MVRVKVSKHFIMYGLFLNKSVYIVNKAQSRQWVGPGSLRPKKSGNFKICKNGQGNFKYLSSQGKVGEYPKFGPKLFGCGRYFIRFEWLMTLFFSGSLRSLSLITNS